MTNILIVEDDIALCDGIALSLQSNDICLQKAYNLADARSILIQSSIHLIILDINLPDGNGLNFLTELRNTLSYQSLKLILLTANDLELDIVTGLEQGADDYITKPFSLAVLRARVHAQLRTRLDKAIFTNNKFHFDFNQMSFYVEGSSIELSKTEQKLLKVLVENCGITLSRNTLIDRIWTDGSEFVDENALSVSIKRLRTKLNSNDCIKTIYGIGYSWIN